jgi:pilus assembly protein FimV
LTDIKENNLSISSFGESPDNEAVKELLQITDGSLDFNLISFEDEVVHDQQNNESIDFDLNTISTKTEELSETLESFVSKARDVKVNDEFESFDFDFGSNKAEVREIDELDVINIKESVKNYELTDSLSDKLSDLNSGFANDSFEKNIYLDRPISGLNGENFDHKSGLDFFDLTDMDELETKLDLAKAYIDMSDTDAAKDMACEVLEKGTAEQKKIAQALLNDLE